MSEAFPIRPHAPLDIRDGVIHYKIYGQDGEFIPMTCCDTPDMRHFVEWVRRFDRYTESGDKRDADEAARSSVG